MPRSLRSLLAVLGVAASGACVARPEPVLVYVPEKAKPDPLPSRVVLAEKPARSFSVAVRVDEAAGVARRSSPCLAAVPLPREAGVRAASELSLLTEAAVPVACQVRVLSRWDGKPADASKLARWVLLAFECDLGSHRTKTLRLVKKANDWKPEAPVSVTKRGDSLVLDTGAIQAELGGAGVGCVKRAGEVVARSLRAYVREGDSDMELARPPSIEVLEAGPVRGVVRLTGRLSRSLGYALTVEGWAGRSELRLSLETRNSDPHVARTVRLGELGLAVDLPSAAGGVLLPDGERGLAAADALVLEQLAPAAKGKEPRFSLGLEGGARLASGTAHEGWVDARCGKTSIGIASRKPVSRAPSGLRLSGSSLVLRFVTPPREGAEGPLRARWLADLQHRTDEAILFFGAEKPREASDLVASFRSRLQGAPDASWIRDSGGFLGPLADEQDERSAYGACGLELGAEKRRSVAAEPAFEVGEPNIKWDTETDEARDLFLQWLRTGERGAFDEGCAWAEFLRDRYAPRTGGFSFQDSERRPSDDAGDVAKLAKTLEQARWKESHIYGEGLVAHYLLTGDRSSLEAARDLEEMIAWRLKDVGPAAPIVEVRCFARPLQLLCALSEVTGEYREEVERFVACAFSSPTRDEQLGCYAIKMYVGDFDLDSVLPRGLSLRETFPRDAEKGLFQRGPRTLHIKGERACWPYQDRELAHALARAFEVTGDERARQALLGLADYYTKEGLVPCFYRPELEMTPYFTLPYVPEPEVARYEQPSVPLYSTNLGLVEAAAFLVSGDERFLSVAKKCLRIAALRGHRDLRPLGPDEKKIRIPTAIQWGRGFDDLRTFVALSRRIVQPAAPAELAVRRGPREGTVELSFVPGDERAARWIVQGAPSPIAPGKAFSAELLAREPARKGRERVVLVVPAKDATWFAVSAEDESGVLGPPCCARK